MEWNKEQDEQERNKYITSIFVYCNELEKEDALLDIMKKAQSIGISFDSFHANRKGDVTVYNLDIYVKDLNHLNTYVRDLEKLSYIEKVVRIVK